MKLTSSFLIAALCAIQFAAASPAELPYGYKEEPPRTRTRVVEVTETVNPPVRPPPVTRTVTATERITVTVTRQSQCTAPPPPPRPRPSHRHLQAGTPRHGVPILQSQGRRSLLHHRSQSGRCLGRTDTCLQDLRRAGAGDHPNTLLLEGQDKDPRSRGIPEEHRGFPQ
ncbi:hypothetical protein HGRIS_010596 [Hohenbuehelia grisea]|uniref:Uncharacterized protein n=1 Tax=Hohenbuehelia grisea TaxID=104357 RepID=A0ABR3IX87_9AGAR